MALQLCWHNCVELLSCSTRASSPPAPSGLNCGRWDYIFSFGKKLRAHPRFVLPDRTDVTMWVMVVVLLLRRLRLRRRRLRLLQLLLLLLLVLLAAAAAAHALA